MEPVRVARLGFLLIAGTDLWSLQAGETPALLAIIYKEYKQNPDVNTRFAQVEAIEAIDGVLVKGDGEQLDRPCWQGGDVHRVSSQ
jgi:hypothetical protein